MDPTKPIHNAHSPNASKYQPVQPRKSISPSPETHRHQRNQSSIQNVNANLHVSRQGQSVANYRRKCVFRSKRKVQPSLAMFSPSGLAIMVSCNGGKQSQEFNEVNSAYQYYTSPQHINTKDIDAIINTYSQQIHQSRLQKQDKQQPNKLAQNPRKTKSTQKPKTKLAQKQHNRCDQTPTQIQTQKQPHTQQQYHVIKQKQLQHNLLLTEYFLANSDYGYYYEQGANHGKTKNQHILQQVIKQLFGKDVLSSEHKHNHLWQLDNPNANDKGKKYVCLCQKVIKYKQFKQLQRALPKPKIFNNMFISVERDKLRAARNTQTSPTKTLHRTRHPDKTLQPEPLPSSLDSNTLHSAIINILNDSTPVANSLTELSHKFRQSVGSSVAQELLLKSTIRSGEMSRYIESGGNVWVYCQMCKLVHGGNVLSRYNDSYLIKYHNDNLGSSKIPQNLVTTQLYPPNSPYSHPHPPISSIHPPFTPPNLELLALQIQLLQLNKLILQRLRAVHDMVQERQQEAGKMREREKEKDKEKQGKHQSMKHKSQSLQILDAEELQSYGWLGSVYNIVFVLLRYIHNIIGSSNSSGQSVNTNVNIKSSSKNKSTENRTHSSMPLLALSDNYNQLSMTQTFLQSTKRSIQPQEEKQKQKSQSIKIQQQKQKIQQKSQKIVDIKQSQQQKELIDMQNQLNQ